MTPGGHFMHQIKLLFLLPLDMSNYFHPSHLTLKRIESKSLGQEMSYQKMKNAILKGIDSIRTRIKMRRSEKTVIKC